LDNRGFYEAHLLTAIAHRIAAVREWLIEAIIRSLNAHGGCTSLKSGMIPMWSPIYTMPASHLTL
jgi:hypothetical protein